MTEALSTLADIIQASGSPLGILALVALLFALLAYAFFNKESVRVKLTVFLVVGLGAFALGAVVVKGFSTEPQKIEPLVVDEPQEANPISIPEGDVDNGSKTKSPPPRLLVSLDGQQSRSVAYWAGGARSASFDCPREVSEGFELVVVLERSEDLGRRRGRCVGSGSYCDSHNEFCREFYFVDACYVNKEWHDWYKATTTELGIPYSKEAVCAKQPAA